jgi:glutathione S-transferase
MTITITAFESSPDRGAGLARDMIVRWALEEVGQAYDVRLVPWSAFKEPAHRKLQPFAQRFPGLLPGDANAHARAIAWMFAAVSSVEPVIVQREVSEYLESDKSWNEERIPLVEERIHKRLGDLSARLGDGEWLDGAFSAGDLLMVQVLRRLEGSDLLAAFPNLAAYVERGKARPAFKRAFAAQLAVFAGRAAGG